MKIKFIAASVLSTMIAASAVYADDMQSHDRSQATIMTQPDEMQSVTGSDPSPNVPNTATTMATPRAGMNTSTTTGSY